MVLFTMCINYHHRVELPHVVFFVCPHALRFSSVEEELPNDFPDDVFSTHTGL
jgi:hypothetical protein